MLFGESLLFFSGLLVLLAGALLTIRTRGVQFRKLPEMVQIFFRKGDAGEHTIAARRALFTAMSTTLGMSTLVSPVIAIRLGGPGALVGFLIATVLGAAVSFTEVTLALTHREKTAQGIIGGPMPYLSKLHPLMGKFYACACFTLMMVWSAANANQLGQMLQSPFMGQFALPSWVTGGLLCLLVLTILVGGTRRVASFSAKLVPTLFVVYLGSALWILVTHLSLLPTLVHQIFASCLEPQAFGSGFVVGGLMSALRWGVFKGLQSNEAGIGTQTIPHSMAETTVPVDQGILSMFSTYAAGFLCLVSGLVALITQTWLDPSLSLGIEMVAASFASVFATMGVLIVTLSALLFAFGTILGNSYNGIHCFHYLTGKRLSLLYYVASAGLIFWGSVTEARVVWSVIDYFLLPVAVPHILCVVWLTYRPKAVPV